MPEFHAAEAFTVTLPSGETHTVARGKSDVPQEVADHWFAKAHAVGTPKGRMPMVEGADGLLIEADEAGQRVTGSAMPRDPMLPPSRQEGPVEWSRSPAAREAAERAAEDAGAPVLDAVDGPVESRKLLHPSRVQTAPVVAQPIAAARPAAAAPAAATEPTTATPAKAPPLPSK